MAGSRAKRYAQAIYELAVSGDASSADERVDKWSDDLVRVDELVGNEEFLLFLQHAAVPFQRKVDVIGEALADVDGMARNLLCVMTSQGNPGAIGEVSREFQRLLDAQRGVARVKAISAAPLSDAEKRAIEEFVKRQTGGEVAIEASVDPSIIGGLTLRIGDKLLDGSVKARLETMKEELQTASMRT